MFADINLPEDIIHLSLDELRNNNLIEDDYISVFSGMNRRDVIRKVGLASMVALPVISALIAPAAVNAASNCGTSGQACTTGTSDGQGICCANFRCFGFTSGNCAACFTQNHTYATTTCSSQAGCLGVCNDSSARNRCCNSGSATTSYNTALGGVQSVDCNCP